MGFLPELRRKDGEGGRCMITIKLIDARRGLYLKCKELFGDEKIAENIYKYLCEGIEECEECEPERKTGKWNFIGDNLFECSCCNIVYTTQQLNGLRNYNTDPYAPKFCPFCGADMRIENEI